MKLPEFQLFLGIDQTGALKKPGLCVPLKVAVFESKSRTLHLMDRNRNPLRLQSFQKDEVDSLLKLFPSVSNEIAISIDCVFGLPAPCLKTPFAIWKIAPSTKAFAYGKAGGAQFFRSLWNKKQIPTRVCEELAGANSVFRTEPAQKNIQTGTFRIWKDLESAREPWFQLWPFDLWRFHSRKFASPPSLPWVFEGFPSLLWKKIFETRVRSPKILTKLLNNKIPDLQIQGVEQLEDPDIADAAVLATGTFLLATNQRLQRPKMTARLKKEGWILGLDFPKALSA